MHKIHTHIYSLACAHSLALSRALSSSLTPSHPPTLSLALWTHTGDFPQNKLRSSASYEDLINGTSAAADDGTSLQAAA